MRYRTIIHNFEILIKNIETDFESNIDLDKYHRSLFEQQKNIIIIYFNDNLNLEQKKKLKYIYDKYNELLFEMNTDKKFIKRNIISLFFKKMIYKLGRWYKK